MRNTATWIVRTLGMAAMALVLGRPAVAQHYTVTDLGTLPKGSLSAGAGINNLGEIVGSSFQNPLLFGFLYHNKRMTSIGTPSSTPCNPQVDRAVAINDKGQVVYDGNGTASLWHNGVLAALNTPTNVFAVSGKSINNAGWIVGGADETRRCGSAQIGFVYQNGQFSDLGTLGGSYCLARGINDNGQVVGESSKINGSVHAFVFQLSSTGQVISRKDLGAPTGGSSTAAAINLSGEAVGNIVTANFFVKPVLFSGGKRIPLGLLPNMTEGFANAINASGQIVGTQMGNDTRAFLYSSGALHDLNTLISDPSWTLMEARGINDSGQIVGTGMHNGEEHAFLLTPQ